MKSSFRIDKRNRGEEKKFIGDKEINLPGEPNILIVDDESLILNLINSILKIKGLKSDTVSSLKGAKEAIFKKEYDIVFLDLGLPDGSGFSLLEELVEVSPEVLIVVTTGMYDLEIAVKAMRKGAFDYITKPFSVKLFRERLDMSIKEWKVRTLTNRYQIYLESLVEKKERELRNTVHDIDRIRNKTVVALGSALNLRDPETEDHCRRVSKSSIILGKAIGIKGQELQDLKWGAYLHDIGKIGIEESILLKSGSLNEDEMKMVKKHPFLGYSMIVNINFLSGAAKVVLYHHEKYDGSGYPLGLYGEYIPFNARVFSVIDAFDAMISDRPYRKALTYDIVVNELNRCYGVHFDPQVIDTFMKLDFSQLHEIKRL